ncbi:bifunctional folylpolyglutamate synthase/dihydrofolate synthase [Paenactinomyces guangxiensis]|uniref:Dihydrofolate synthase/folylpolyglutamate synthase n=1 Tax=Paenactinomyces guangxiensis TaxID=1490290 RepID=A0A7W2A908_9BACL|nr:folylpolyglutamate synthase/dihydrofolate synthase family protein [Paenactinomyces guangxiensis]MBA4496141.1 bifunctional folylpolyglutamate synthase/dihydrofolate synthase [Paenactinomyces guangxiensis]MBH8593229.1 bifunctional folylpolyglutamate synthase/dihydrofolate synthase [Paenactinomyces guangxiensis]
MDQTKMFATSEEVFHWMEHRCVRTIQPGLERMEWILNRIDHPERRCKFIHIAGTNGKGSTAAMISSVLREAGYPTGLFISPYVTNWNERIQFDGEPIAESSFVHWANFLRPLADEMAEHGPGAPSPFEFWTLIAICYFAYEASPWFIVWETGLGGRCDSTNVVYPLVSVITHIGFDHKDWLGETIAEIAREKAGIIKAGVPVVCGSENKEALAVITEQAKQKNSSLYVIHKNFQAEPKTATPNGQRFHFTNAYGTLSDLEIPLVGEHQIRNAGTALMALEVLRQHYATVLEREHIEQGLKKTSWPGRLEKVSDQPLIVLDGAHNPDGIHSLVSSVRQLYTYDHLILMVAMMRDKDITEMIQPLLPLAHQVIATQVQDLPRALPAEELAQQVRQLNPELSVQSASTAEEGLRLMKKKAGEKDLLLITGSLFLISEVRPLLIKEYSE